MWQLRRDQSIARLYPRLRAYNVSFPGTKKLLPLHYIRVGVISPNMGRLKANSIAVINISEVFWFCQKMKNPAAKTAGYLNVWNYFFYIRSLTPRQADGECTRYPFHMNHRANEYRSFSHLV